jgi:hypothetical protein
MRRPINSLEDLNETFERRGLPALAAYVDSMSDIMFLLPSAASLFYCRALLGIYCRLA